MGATSHIISINKIQRTHVYFAALVSGKEIDLIEGLNAYDLKYSRPAEDAAEEEVEVSDTTVIVRSLRLIEDIAVVS
jgi:hypothetical protein